LTAQQLSGYNLDMDKIWTDAPLLYFHFNSSNGVFASLPMRRVTRIFQQEFKGVPGTKKTAAGYSVPCYQCLGCGRVFFSPDRDGLKHSCMNHGGIVSESLSMGA
jgi:hypothetical protein